LLGECCGDDCVLEKGIDEVDSGRRVGGIWVP
jgi:hypothetical protein